jgi:hypothetical protein
VKNLSVEVSFFLDELNHPFRNEIDELRKCILAANIDLTENIKWNGPNYSIHGEDRITMRVQPLKKQVQLIFHCGAKKQEQPKDKLIENQSGLLFWKENDRAIATFKSMLDIENAKGSLTNIVNEWLNAVK